MELIKKNGLEGECRDYICYPKAIPEFEPSELIKAVKLDRYRYHTGEGDMWPLCWAEDDHIYAGAGDNKGCATNIWRITSNTSFKKDGSAMDHSKLTNTNDWSMDMINPQPVDYFKLVDLPTPNLNPGSILDIGGRLYLAVEAQDYGTDPLFCRQQNYYGWIVTSDDGGKTWNETATDTRFFTGRLSSCHFIQYGRGYRGAVDEYVYAHFPADENGNSYWENADFLLLGRVHKDKILQREAWEFVVGLEGEEPIWDKDGDKAIPVFSYYKMTGADHCAYCEGIGRYILGNYSFIDENLHPRPIHQMRWPEAYRSQLTLFEAEHPWGPWKIFHRDDDWGTYGDYQPNFPTKWMSKDGRMLFMISSGSWDDYCFVVQKLALKLKGDEAFPDAAKWFDFR